MFNESGKALLISSLQSLIYVFVNRSRSMNLYVVHLLENMIIHFWN